MKQIIVLHGGTTFASYDAYIEDLRTKKVRPERLAYMPTWKETLQQKLGVDYQVLLPSMPNKTNARYDEWKIWFDRIAEVIENGCILVGHSLGGIFLAKYLSENKFPRTITATVLIAAPFSDESVESLTDFKLQGLTPLFTQQAGKVVLLNGSDDPVVSIDELECYKSELPNAESIVLAAPDHFTRPEFPELLEVLRKF